MLEAAFWGFAGASSLLIGAAIGATGWLSERVTGLILAFGAGTLVSAVAFELTEEAFELGGADAVAAGLALGALAYYLGSITIPDKPGEGLLLGAILDGIPESVVIGISLIGGGSVGVPILAAVFISNTPEGISGSAEMRTAKPKPSTRRVLTTWSIVCVVSAIAAAAGFGLLDHASDEVIAIIDAFAGGAVLAMLTVTMFPEAFASQKAQGRAAGNVIGLMTVLGFAVAYLLSTLE
jgi:ZIP family zinc transporter